MKSRIRSAPSGPASAAMRAGSAASPPTALARPAPRRSPSRRTSRRAARRRFAPRCAVRRSSSRAPSRRRSPPSEIALLVERSHTSPDTLVRASGTPIACTSGFERREDARRQPLVPRQQRLGDLLGREEHHREHGAVEDRAEVDRLRGAQHRRGARAVAELGHLGVGERAGAVPRRRPARSRAAGTPARRSRAARARRSRPWRSGP